MSLSLGKGFLVYPMFGCVTDVYIIWKYVAVLSSPWVNAF